MDKDIKDEKMNKESVNEMLNTSLEDIREYDASVRAGTPKLSRLRDGANKLLGALEEFTAYKKSNLFRGYSDFERNFLSLKIGISYEQKRNLLNDLKTLHIFFYYGLVANTTASDIKYIYNKSYKVIKMIVNKG